jgi:site-specific recombinase XerD
VKRLANPTLRMTPTGSPAPPLCHALHTHATELVNAGVSLATIRKRLGHRNLQTTLRYAEQSDAVADAELRAWRRRRHQGR